MMATFTAAAIQSAFENIAVDLHVSLEKASYLTSMVIAIIGVAPLIWRPVSDRYGRRPVFLVSLSCNLIGNVGCAVSRTYSTMALCRAITAFRFPSRTSALHGSLDVDGHAWGTCRSLPPGFRYRASELSVDLLDSCHCE
jgi:MFS family permease